MCDGPFVWYPCTEGAVLHCTGCGQITTTGNWNDAEHTDTEILPGEKPLMDNDEQIEHPTPRPSSPSRPFQITVMVCLVILIVLTGITTVITYRGWSRQQAEACAPLMSYMGFDVKWAAMSKAQQDYADKLGCDISGKP